MNKRIIQVSAPYNPVAFHLLQRDDPTAKEIEEYNKAEESNDQKWQSVKHLSSEKIEEHYKSHADQYGDIYNRMAYIRGVASKSYIVGKNNIIPVNKIEPESLFIPTVNISSCPLLNKKEAKILYKHFESKELAHQHIFNRAKDSLKRQIDTLALQVINAAVDSDHTITVIDNFGPPSVDLAFSLIDKHELPRGLILMHANTWRLFEYWEPKELIKTDYDIENPKKDEAPIWAYYKKIPILVCTMCPQNAVYVLSKKEYTGIIKVIQDIKVYENDYIKGSKPKDFSILEYKKNNNKIPIFNADKNLIIEDIEAGWTLEAEIGVGVVNDYSIVKILVYDNNVNASQNNALKENYHEALVKLYETEKELEEAKKIIVELNSQVKIENIPFLGTCADQSIY
jgi:hypothetical protein